MEKNAEKRDEKRLKELDKKPDLFRDTINVKKQEKASLQVQLQIA